MIAKGTYPHPKGYPIIGGLEISGRVAKLGVGRSGRKGWRRRRRFFRRSGRLCRTMRRRRRKACAHSERNRPRHRRRIPDPGVDGLAHSSQCQRHQAGRRHSHPRYRRRAWPVCNPTGGASRSDCYRHGRHCRQGEARFRIWRGEGDQSRGRGFRRSRGGVYGRQRRRQDRRTRPALAFSIGALRP